MFEMDNIPYWGFVSFGVLIILLVIGIIFSRLYERASAEQSFVRTGLNPSKKHRLACLL